MVTRPITPPQSQITVTIDEVDVVTRTVHAHDKTNAPIQASFRTAPGGAFRIPAQGELWTCQRTGFQWYLGDRIDTVSEHTYANDLMSPGDTRVAADGTLHVRSESILFNNQPVGAMTYEVFDSDGINKTYTLEIAPVSSHSVQAFVNGLLVDPRGITVNGATLTFLIPPPAGFFMVYYQRAGYVYADAATVISQAVITGAEPFSLTQPALARIQKTISVTHPAVARLQKTFTKTQTATANITGSIIGSKTQTAIARIQTTLTHTQSALATIAPVFGTPPVTLDNFNRADGALGANWTLNELGEASSDLSILTNTLGRTGTANGGTAYLNGFTEDRTVVAVQKSIQYTTIMASTTQEVAIHYLVSNFGASTLDGYHIEYSNGVLSIYKITNGSFGVLGSQATPLSNGDSFGVILTTNGDHFAYTNHGGTWHPIFKVHDTTYSVGRTGIKIGAVTDARVDNLMGTTQAILGYNTPSGGGDDNGSGVLVLTNQTYTTDSTNLKPKAGYAYITGFSTAGTQSQAMRLCMFADDGTGTAPSTTLVAVTDEVIIDNTMTPAWVKFPSFNSMGGAPTLTANTKYWLGWWTGPTGAGGGLAVIGLLSQTVGGTIYHGPYNSSATYSSTANPTVSAWSFGTGANSYQYDLYFVTGG